jgi:hypothetical protein
MRPFLMLAATLGLAPSVAAAGEVTTIPVSRCTPSGCPVTELLTFRADPGERNVLSVDHEAGGPTRIRDSGVPLRSSGRCDRMDDASVFCLAGFRSVFDLGDGDDRAFMRMYLATLRGGPGDDQLEVGHMIGHGSSPDDRIEAELDGGDGDDRLIVEANFIGRARCGRGADVVIFKPYPSSTAMVPGDRRQALGATADDCERVSFAGGLHVSDTARCAAPVRTALLLPARAKHVRVARASLRLDRRPLKVVRSGGRLRYLLDLRKRRGERVTVRGVLRGRDGTPLMYSRTLRVC